MANEIKEMSEIIKKCKILLLDIEGTTTSISFVKEKLFPYAEENVKQFLDSQWDSDDVKEAVSGLRKLALEDKENNVEGLVPIPGEESTKEEQIEGLVSNVKWQMSSDRKVGALKLLQGLIWKQGYDSGDIKGHVYDDVSPALELWHSAEGQKVYIYSSGSVDAQKLLFGQSLAGNLLHLIDGHFDTAVGAKQEAASYQNIVEKIGCKADEILFLTDIPKEAEAAKASGLNAALVSREGNAPLPAEATESFPVIHSFQQLAATNKRKPDTQDEQPAKVPKTDVEDDVKSLSETEPKTEVAAVPCVPEEIKEAEKSEAMEVEEAPEVKSTEEVAHEKKAEDTPVETSTTVEEISNSKDIGDTPVVDIKSIVSEETEKIGKTEQNETEKMEAEIEIETPKSNESKESAEIKNGSPTEPIAEETPPTVITEIEELTEKQDLADVDEIIDDLEPVVEEPPAVEDMEDLQNVGEVLEKECDEILSKVQDVTNLDNIPIKPLLNTITEEAMETENADSNDIVDRILDTELEIENMKECEDIDLNTVQEITDTKSDATEDKSEKVESSVTKKVPDADEKNVQEKMEEVKENDATDGNIVSSPKQTEKDKDTEKEVETKLTENEKAEIDSAKPEVDSKEAETEDSAPSITEELKEKEEAVVEEVKAGDTPEKQLNGKATNGDAAESKLNGDASKDEELSSRLSVEENGKEMNGSNGETNGAANGEADKGENSKEEVTDIKVKSVAVDEPPTDPIEQPTEA